LREYVEASLNVMGQDHGKGGFMDDTRTWCTSATAVSYILPPP
jgi:hypothetical protein